MNTIDIIKERYRQLQSNNGSSMLTPIEQNAFDAFNQMGIPTVRNEEWKYTRISGAFNKEYAFQPGQVSISEKELEVVRLPAYAQANELVFVNGHYSRELSNIRSNNLTVLSLEEATKNEYREIVLQHLGH